jgi:hypothetical protein
MSFHYESSWERHPIEHVDRFDQLSLDCGAEVLDWYPTLEGDAKRNAGRDRCTRLTYGSFLGKGYCRNY